MPFLLQIAGVLALASLFSTGASHRTEREAWVMGTRLRIVVEAIRPALAAEATETVLREVEAMDRMLSTWDPDSEMARVNNAAPGHPVSLHHSLAHLLAEARAWSQRTHGAFEPAVGALVDAWALRGEGRLPSTEEVAAALAASGPEAIQLREAEGTVLRTAAAAWMDTGAFGKGAALRKAAGHLGAQGVVRAMVDLGGQLWVAADPSHPWFVAVADPLNRNHPTLTLALFNVSVATSGGSERWVEIQGHRFGHILDPRTGVPAPDWGSVTVVSGDPMEADALSTALYVMGPGPGLAWIEREAPHVAALFLEPAPGGVRASWSPAMERWFAPGSFPGPSTSTTTTHTSTEVFLP